MVHETGQGGQGGRRPATFQGGPSSFERGRILEIVKRRPPGGDTAEKRWSGYLRGPKGVAGNNKVAHNGTRRFQGGDGRMAFVGQASKQGFSPDLPGEEFSIAHGKQNLGTGEFKAILAVGLARAAAALPFGP